MNIRWFPYQLADAKAMEAELNRLAAEGWELKWLRLDLACFHRSGRRDLRCAVEPRPICYSDQDQAAWDQADRDYIQLCADAGWEAALTTRLFRIFASIPGRSPAPLQTDDALYFESKWDRQLRAAAISSLWDPFARLLPLLVIGWLDQMHLWMFLSSPGAILLSVILLFFLLLNLFRSLSLFHTWRQFRQCVEQGEELPASSPAAVRLRGVAGSAVWLLILLFLFLSLSLGSGQRTWQYGDPGAAQQMAAQPVLRPEDLGLVSSSAQSLSLERSPFLFKVSALTFAQDGPDIDTLRYEARWPWLAEIIARDLMKDITRNRGHRSGLYTAQAGFVPLTAPGFDAAWTAPAERGHQILVFQAGTVAARITAPLDLTEPEMLAVIQARLLGMDAMR